MKGKTVFVGLSGGVDSSVAATLLQEKGYNVVGVFIKVWHPDFLQCEWEQERLDAMRVAAHLNIPFLTCDAEDEYRTQVAHYFIEEYKNGRTPNPDVMCNRHIKFGAFYRFAMARGADYIATGHYARISKDDGLYRLLRGIDTNKDQSYFLWTMTQEVLGKTLLPIGEMTKDEVRTEAKRRGLYTAEKSDSQGICFLGHIDIPEFLSHFITLKKGAVVDIQTGKTVGEHNGTLVYTIGQRHGFSLQTVVDGTKPHYIVRKDNARNILYVDTQYPKTPQATLLTLSNVHWIGKPAGVGQVLQAQSRYRQKPFNCKITSMKDATLILDVLTETDAWACGQSCVLYADDVCIGGGIIAQ